MTSPTVYIVDDDQGMRSSLAILLETAQLKSESFAKAEDFLKICDSHQQGCLLLDVRMPGMSGPELQEEMARRQVSLPIIFLTAYGDLATGVEVMRHGAVDFLTKPINGTQLLERVQAALALDATRCRVEETRYAFEMRLLKLTDREREVLGLALSGMASKEIADRLRISLRTVEGHRSRIFLKTGVASLFHLAQQAAEAGVKPADILPKPDAAAI